MKEVTLVKLGGSAITHKSVEGTPDLATLNASITQLSSYDNPLILLHGAGSFAHPLVRRQRLDQGLRRRSQLRAIGETGLYVEQLTRIVEVSLLRQNIPFVTFRPLSFVSLRNGRIDEVFLKPIKLAIRIGLIPLIHGDLAFDSSRGVAVISADQLASRLAIEFEGSRVLFGCDVDGVFTQDPKQSGSGRIIHTIDKESATQVLGRLVRGARDDVTEGMYGKVNEALVLAKSGHPSYIFNLRKRGMLGKALSGDFGSGTWFPAWGS